MLYIVGTPIGNMHDLSYRQAKTLSEADVILSEDTRSTYQLLAKITQLFQFPSKQGQIVVSYYQEKEFEKLPEVLEWLHENKQVALVSESGMPIISDPGSLLLKHVLKDGLPFTVVPGPSALTTALIHSGFSAKEFCFLGYFPKRTGERTKMCERIKELKKLFPEMSVIFYESPHRIQAILQLLSKELPKCAISISRELTKFYEETSRGSADDLAKKQYKGELTILLS